MMTTRILFYQYLILLFTLGELALGQDTVFNQGHDMATHLPGETIAFNSPANAENSITDVAVADVTSSSGSSAAQRIKWLLQVKGPSTAKWQSLINEYLAERNAYLIHYFPHNTYLVQGPKTQSFRQFLKAGPGVWQVRLFKAQYKLSQTVKDLLNTPNQTNSSKKLRVRLFTNLGLTPPPENLEIANELVQSFQAWLQQNSLSSTVKVLSYSLLLVTINEPSLLSSVVTWLSEQPDVLYIELKLRTEPKNYYANRVVQGDSVSNLPLTTGGLKGDGMIIGIGDSGLDINSCFFWDPNVPVSYNQFMPNHRKIAYYRTNLNPSSGPTDIAGKPRLFEHGTHTSGTLAGSVFDTSYSAGALDLSRYNGLAPNARLAFTQFYDAQGHFNSPDDVEAYFHHQQFQEKATLSSNSWGTSAPADYDADSEGTDRYVYGHPKFLVIFCAGNEGALKPWGFGTLDGGSQSKNSIIVGAGFSSATAYSVQGLDPYRKLYKLTFNPGNFQFIPYKANFGSYDLNVANFQNVPVVHASPADACSAVSDLTGKVALVDATTATCNYGTEGQNVQDAGAIMLIVYNTSQTKAKQMPDTGGDNVDIPAFEISASFFQSISSATTVTLSEIKANEWQVPPFTSRGPTTDGRIKPDVLAPGVDIRSAKTDGIVTGPAHCDANDWLSDTGTSMATPVTAAMAALVQQYYNTGYYPSGTKKPGNAFFPIASLTKATILASAVPLKGSPVVDPQRIETLHDKPDPIQGYGRIQLNTVLYFASDATTNPGKKLWVTKNQSRSISTGGRDLFCFSATPTSLKTTPGSPETYPSLRATLVWTDPPPAAGAQTLVLMNNLDLAVVRVSNGQMFLGNGFGAWDVVNNVEQVTLRNTDVASGGEFFAVIVNGVNVPQGPQVYSLVVNGHITSVANGNCAGALAFCPNLCHAGNSWGTCNAQTGTCTCVGGQAGSDCSVPNPTHAGVEISVTDTIVPYQYKYFQVPVSSGLYSGLHGVLVSVYASPESASTDVFISFTSPPSRIAFNLAIFSVPDVLNPWSKFFPAANLSALAGGGTLFFAISGYCCGNNTFTVNVSFQPKA